MELNRIWSEIELWLGGADEACAAGLNVGADPAQISRFVSRFPSASRALVESYRRHDGEDWDSEFVFGSCRWLLPIEDSIGQADNARAGAIRSGTLDVATEIEVFGPVSPFDWSEFWIPFLLDNDVLYCVDMAPANGGHEGQVILVDLEDLSLTRVAASFEAFFEKAVRARIDGLPWPFRGRHPFLEND